MAGKRSWSRPEMQALEDPTADLWGRFRGRCALTLGYRHLYLVNNGTAFCETLPNALRESNPCRGSCSTVLRTVTVKRNYGV